MIAPIVIFRETHDPPQCTQLVRYPGRQPRPRAEVPRDSARHGDLPRADASKPSDAGTLVYRDAGASLNAVLAHVEAAGGRITTPKVRLPGDMGCLAHIADTAVNRVGLHASR